AAELASAMRRRRCGLLRHWRCPYQRRRSPDQRRPAASRRHSDASASRPERQAGARAAADAVDKSAIAQVLGRPRIAAPATQLIVPGNAGYPAGFNAFPATTGGDDPSAAKALLAQADTHTA